MKHFSLGIIVLSLIALVACKSQTTKNEPPTAKKDSVEKFNLKVTGPVGMGEEGMNVDHYSNGKEKMKGLIKNGKREGLWQAWYETGILWSEAEYHEGVNHGFSKTYFENGKVRYQGNYENGKKVGDWKYYDENGTLVKTIPN